MLQRRGLYLIEEGGIPILPEAIAGRRFVRWTGTGGTFSLTLAGNGQLADAVTGDGSGGTVKDVLLRTPGALAVLEAGAVVAQGAELQSDASGRAITLAAGQRLGRALEAAAGAGSVIWCALA